MTGCFWVPLGYQLWTMIIMRRLSPGNLLLGQIGVFWSVPILSNTFYSTGSLPVTEGEKNEVQETSLEQETEDRRRSNGGEKHHRRSQEARLVRVHCLHLALLSPMMILIRTRSMLGPEGRKGASDHVNPKRVKSVVSNTSIGEPLFCDSLPGAPDIRLTWWKS